MSAEKGLLNELIYASYKRQRELAPHISPQSWAMVLPDVPAMERRYQQEISDYANAGVKRDQAERLAGRPQEYEMTTDGRLLKAGT